MYTVSEIIEALGKHADDNAVGVLEEVGTNSSDNEVRKMTAKALIERNTHEALKVLIINKGKGIHDYNENVANSVIEMLNKQQDKEEVLKILDDTIKLHSDNEVKSKAQQVKNMLLKSTSPFILN